MQLVHADADGPLQVAHVPLHVAHWLVPASTKVPAGHALTHVCVTGLSTCGV